MRNHKGGKNLKKEGQEKTKSGRLEEQNGERAEV